MNTNEILIIVENNANAIPSALYMLAGQNELALEARGKNRTTMIAVIPDEDAINPDSGVVELTPDDIKAIHGKLVEMFTGTPEILDYGTFEQICISPYQEVFGEVLFPGVFKKAAKYLYSIDGSQVFADGNKRTSIMTAITFLAINGYKFTMPEDEITKLVMDVANDKSITVEEIASIFEANTVSLK